jgi:hypothetical protein
MRELGWFREASIEFDCPFAVAVPILACTVEILGCQHRMRISPMLSLGQRHDL